MVLLPDCLLFPCEKATLGNPGENGSAAADNVDVEVDTIGEEETAEEDEGRVLCMDIGWDIEAGLSWIETEETLEDDIPDPDSINSSEEGSVVTKEVQVDDSLETDEGNPLTFEDW